MLRKKITLKSSREKLTKPSIKLATVRKFKYFFHIFKEIFQKFPEQVSVKITVVGFFRFFSKYLRLAGSVLVQFVDGKSL